MHLSITILIVSALLGFMLGIFTGLIPGIHVNNIAMLLVVFSPFFMSMGFSKLYIAVIILSNSIAHTFLDIIPSVFLGAPDADTSLAVLPGHRLLMEGRGPEAVRLSAIGSAGSVIVSLIIAPVLGFLFMNIYDTLNSHMGWILILIVILMIATEKGEIIEGQASLAHLKFKIYALILFLISGMLGLFAFNNEDLMQPVIAFGDASILFPLLSGLFGASMLIISLMTQSSIPPQENTGFEFPKQKIVRGIITGSMAGAFVAWLPGVSSAIGTVIARLFITKGVGSSKEFIISISGANTANAIFSLIALFIIQKTRSGAMVAINKLIHLDISVLLVLLMVVVYVSLLSYYVTIYLGDRIPKLLYRIDYSRL